MTDSRMFGSSGCWRLQVWRLLCSSVGFWEVFGGSALPFFVFIFLFYFFSFLYDYLTAIGT